MAFESYSKKVYYDKKEILWNFPSLRDFYSEDNDIFSPSWN